MNVTSKADTRADLHLNLLLPFAEALRQTGPVRPLWTTDKQFQISTIEAVRERSAGPKHNSIDADTQHLCRCWCCCCAVAFQSWLFFLCYLRHCEWTRFKRSLKKEMGEAVCVHNDDTEAYTAHTSNTNWRKKHMHTQCAYLLYFKDYEMPTASKL